MADTRYKDANWNCDSCNGGSGKAETALLMDIRDELKKLNRVFECPNFLGLPRDISKLRSEVSGIRRDLKKKSK